MQYVNFTLPYRQRPACWSPNCKLALVCTNTCLLLLCHLVGLHLAQKRCSGAFTGASVSSPPDKSAEQQCAKQAACKLALWTLWCLLTVGMRQGPYTHLHFLEQGSSLSIVLKVIPHGLQYAVQGDCQGILQVTCTGTKTVVLFTTERKK